MRIKRMSRKIHEDGQQEIVGSKSSVIVRKRTNRVVLGGGESEKKPEVGTPIERRRRFSTSKLHKGSCAFKA